MRIISIFFFFLCALSVHAQDSVAFKPLPWQVSVFPGISTHGRADRQTVNHISLNLAGGVERGLDGVELGGVFNIDLRSIRYVQAAGVFNYVGDSVRGVQAAGLANIAGGPVRGLQAAGLLNLARRPLKGLQAAGLANADGDSVRGTQVAGLANLTRGTVHGAQVAGFYNQARHLKGVQIGIVNVADTSSGYSVGLVNIVHKNGFRQISVWEEDVTGISVGFKSGTSRLYGILLAGFDDWSTTKTYAAGAGIGTRWPLGRQWIFSGELIQQQVFSDSWKYLGEVVRGKPSLAFRLTPHASLSAGPTVNLYTASSNLPAGAHVSDIPGGGWPSRTWGKQTVVWVGAAVGLNFW
ncbi:hypothetical protein [Dinghuibacter silviterrae]|uniref:OmpL-like beta-barrel porin-2 n=1 Tax=Dinghuibacter silviterrae TaxID=1539049 RepID=A0A4R8DIT2_9BACT|nr:hypothetical protein [Dinghuibacter silviterrae]TDW97418.1 hypothetical protein EDB95_5267 [Dinghuibacter silviterrae]